ncbi:hypothetical protein [Volucribacter amazonae]|nr:hypothetical protein [Volucribacter amazonae]
MNYLPFECYLNIYFLHVLVKIEKLDKTGEQVNLMTKHQGEKYE